MQGVVWYRVASNASGEPASYNFGLPRAGGAIGALTAWRGIDTQLLVATTPATNSGSSAAPSAGAVTTTIDEGAALFFVAAQNDLAFTHPTAYEDAYHGVRTVTGAPDHQVSAAVKGIATAGGSGTAGATLGGTAAWHAVKIAVDPLAGTVTPPPPTSDLVLEVSEETATGRNRILTTAASDAAVSVTVTRKHPSGKIVPVRGMDLTSLNAGVFLGYDYEAPIRWGVIYHATAYDSGGNVVGDSIDVPSYFDTEDDWLTDPVRAGRGFTIQVEQAGLPQETYTGQVGVHYVLGRPAPVVISQTRASATGQVSILTSTLAERDKFHLLTAAGGPLLLRTSPERGVRSLYMQPTTITEERMGVLGVNPERRWNIEYVEVDPPPGDITGAQVDWQDVLDTYATWADVVDNVETWIDLVDGRTLTVGGTRELLPWRGT
jgi:hypothetical protein